MYDEAGQPRTVTLADYLIPSAMEIPRIELHHANTPSAALGGFKGCGEGSIIGALGAVACAVVDALSRRGGDISRVSRDPRAGAARPRRSEVNKWVQDHPKRRRNPLSP